MSEVEFVTKANQDSSKPSKGISINQTNWRSYTRLI